MNFSFRDESLCRSSVISLVYNRSLYYKNCLIARTKTDIYNMYAYVCIHIEKKNTRCRDKERESVMHSAVRSSCARSSVLAGDTGIRIYIGECDEI